MRGACVHEAHARRRCAGIETVRKPAFPMDESGVFEERAELRYRLQYESWHR